MPMQVETFDALAACFAYPHAALAANARRAQSALVDDLEGAACAPPLCEALDELAQLFDSGGQSAAEERYTQLFDLKPVATLNLSHHLLGDTYQRGALLAGFVGELRQVNIDAHPELPDHLAVLLRLLGRLEDHADRALLVHAVMIPALRKISSKLTESSGPYPPLLKALPDLLAHNVPSTGVEIPQLRKPLEVLP